MVVIEALPQTPHGFQKDKLISEEKDILEATEAFLTLKRTPFFNHIVSDFNAVANRFTPPISTTDTQNILNIDLSLCFFEAALNLHEAQSKHTLLCANNSPEARQKLSQLTLQLESIFDILHGQSDDVMNSPWLPQECKTAFDATFDKQTNRAGENTEDNGITLTPADTFEKICDNLIMAYSDYVATLLGTLKTNLGAYIQTQGTPTPDIENEMRTQISLINTYNQSLKIVQKARLNL